MGLGGWYCARANWRLRGFGEGWKVPSRVLVDGELFVHWWRVLALADKGFFL